MTTFQIKSWVSDRILFECELNAEVSALGYRFQLGFAVKKAVEGRANLRGADLGGADLRGADLRGADLGDADLRGADLRGADLGGANLRGANLRGADLGDANLDQFRKDMIAEVLKLPNELDALRAAIVEGRIDGSTYSGDCACLAGTLAKARGLPAGYHGENIPVDGIQYIGDAGSPRERWFMMIKPGDTPETNQASKIALGWLDEAIAIRNLIRAVAPAP